MKFYSGIFKAPIDDRDFLVKSFIKIEKLPVRFSLRNSTPPVVSQGAEGSCAGHMAKYGKGYQEFMDTKKMISFSARYPYEYAKLISHHSEGTTIKAICEALLKHGICEDKYWPYKPNDLSGKDPKADKNAANYKIRSYAKVTTIEELKQIIYLSRLPSKTGVKVAFAGIMLYKGAIGNTSRTTGFVPNPTCWDRKIGGHALWPMDWDDESRGYKNDGHIGFEGSWDTTFGDKGFHYFSYKNLKKNMLDCYVALDIPGSASTLCLRDISRKERKKIWV